MASGSQVPQGAVTLKHCSEHQWSGKSFDWIRSLFQIYYVGGLRRLLQSTDRFGGWRSRPSLRQSSGCGRSSTKDFWLAPRCFWKTIWHLRKGKQGTIQAVYSKGGALLTTTEEVIRQWKEQFEKMMKSICKFSCLWNNQPNFHSRKDLGGDLGICSTSLHVLCGSGEGYQVTTQGHPVSVCPNCVQILCSKSRFQRGLASVRAVPCHQSCLSLVLGWEGCSLVGWGSHRCFLQMTWSWWHHQSVTFSTHWISLQQSVKQLGWGSAPLKGSLHGTSFCFRWNTFVVVWPSFYMTTVCWHPWNRKCSKLGSRVESFETTTFFPAV